MVDAETVRKATLKLDSYVPLAIVGGKEPDRTETILRSLLAFAPPGGREYVASEIASCEGANDLRELSKYFFNNLLKPSGSASCISILSSQVYSQSSWRKDPSREPPPIKIPGDARCRGSQKPD
jgi:hypothetical protein